MQPGQVLPRRTKLGRVVECLATFFVGVVGGIAALPLAGVAGACLLPVMIAMTIAAARDMQLTILHHCSHGNVLSGKKRNQMLGRLIATLLFIERFDAYAPKHTIGHHGRHTVSTHDDDTLNFLEDVIGIRPGADVATNRKRFLVGLISPHVHATMLSRRFRSQFVTGGWTNRIGTAAYLGGMAGFAVVTGWWVPVLLGWALPLTLGYQIAQCARFVVEHHWPQEPAQNGRRSAAEHDELTVAVRCAVPPPARWTATTSLQWSAAMAFNVAIRLLVLPGDSGPSHHWHHDQARGDWANHIAEATAWEAERPAKGLPPSREAWGYGAAFRLALESFATAKPEALVPPRLSAPRLVVAG
jgi:fatty acid desaturase